MKPPFYIFLISVFLLTACNEKKELKKDILRMQSCNIILPLKDMTALSSSNQDSLNNLAKEAKFKLIIYTDSSECSSCKLMEMKKWKTAMQNINAHNGMVMTYSIFNSKKEDEDILKFNLRSMSLPGFVYWDKNGIFLRKNPQIPKNPALHAFLIDEYGKIILVGNPLGNKDIEKLFWQQIEKYCL